MTMHDLAEIIRNDLRRAGDPAKIPVLQRFFKTGPGQYGEGDVFIGVMVPESRKIAKTYADSADLPTIKQLLGSPVHEERLVALLMLVIRSKTHGALTAKFYLQNLDRVNSWDLVDLSAPSILGPYLAGADRSLLYKLAKSKNVWKRRVAIITTLHFIRNDDLDDIFRIAQMLLNDEHDLIQKAVGWMLREAGKRDAVAEEKFLRSHYQKMPRTMLRYAIERFPEKKKRFFMRSGDER
jgi:3-methyladenine DNA glycosylase AlkD